MGELLPVANGPHVRLGVVSPVRGQGPGLQPALVDAVGPEQQRRQRQVAQWGDPVGEYAVALRAGAADFADGLDLLHLRGQGEGRFLGAVALQGALGRRRHHAPVAVGVEGVDVAAVVQNGGDGLRVDAAHVIDLGVGLHGDLPVAVQVEGVAGRQAAVVELELPPLVGDGAEPIQQAGGVRVEVDEDQVAEPLAADALEAAAGEVQPAEVLRVPNGQKLALVVVGPAVVLAHQPRALAELFGDDGRSPVAASVVEGVYGAAFRMDDEHRLAGVLPQAEAAGLRRLVYVAGQQPGLAPDVLLLQLVEARVRVAPAGNVRQHRKADGRFRAPGFKLHQVPQAGDFLLVHNPSLQIAESMTRPSLTQPLASPSSRAIRRRKPANWLCRLAMSGCRLATSRRRLTTLRCRFHRKAITARPNVMLAHCSAPIRGFSLFSVVATGWIVA